MCWAEGLGPATSSFLITQRLHREPMGPEESFFFFFPSARGDTDALFLNTICKAVEEKWRKKIRAPFINAAEFNFLYSEKNGLSIMVTCAWRE